MSSLNQYQNLLEKYREIKRLPKRLPTFMELSGYPHFENVCSNILRFYFDTSEVHKLNNLLLKSLLLSLGENTLAEHEIETTDVYREQITYHKKRIDLIIKCNNLVIAIENKIFHWLHNDLLEYGSHIEKKYFDASKKLFVVLSIKPEKNLAANFINITYESFFSSIENNIELYRKENDNIYLTYLQDFMRTIENYYKPKEMNKQMFDFIADNYETIDDLKQDYKSLLDDLYVKLCSISEKIPLYGSHVHKWIWERYVLVHDFTCENDIVIAVDCAIDFKKITIEVFVRNGNVDGLGFLKKLELFSNSVEDFKNSKRGKFVYEKEIPFYEINEDELSSKLVDILNKIKITDESNE